MLLSNLREIWYCWDIVFQKSGETYQISKNHAVTLLGQVSLSKNYSMKKPSIILFAFILLFSSCGPELEELQVEPAQDEQETFSFPETFEFSTSKTIDIQIVGSGLGVVEVLLNHEEPVLLGKFSSQNHTQQFTVATIEQELLLRYTDGINRDSAVFSMIGPSTITWDLSSYGTPSNGRLSSEGCVDRLYAVNGNADFFKIDVTDDEFNLTDLPQLPGGSIANALDQENGIVYINVNRNLYAYHVDSEEFELVFTSNPYNGSYPRFEYRADTFYMGNSKTMYTVNARTNEVIQKYDIDGFVNSSGGGDLAFASDGTLYLACFSGLYKFVDMDHDQGVATVERISAENFPYQLTSMAIDREDRIFVGTNNSNSHLIEISKEDGAYEIVRTYDRKINDLTAWRCATDELTQQDSDNDGIIDELDDHPNDPDAAFDVYTPSEIGYGTLAFEDMWPAQGDFDFNDMVVNYRFVNVLNTSNKSVRLKMELKVVAAGATFKNGFGIELPIGADLITHVEGDQRTDNLIAIDEKGLEVGQSNAVIIPFDNALSLFGGHSIVNTRPTHARFDPVTLSVTVHFQNPVDAALLSAPPYNPFVFVNGDRGREIHLKNKLPTDLANPEYFKSEDDLTDLSINKTYTNEENIPWAINLIHNFRFPTEQTRIDKGYNYFVTWGKSNGVSYQDWYKDNSGYRNVQKLIYLD